MKVSLLWESATGRGGLATRPLFKKCLHPKGQRAEAMPPAAAVRLYRPSKLGVPAKGCIAMHFEKGLQRQPTNIAVHFAHWERACWEGPCMSTKRCYSNRDRFIYQKTNVFIFSWSFKGWVRDPVSYNSVWTTSCSLCAEPHVTELRHGQGDSLTGNFFIPSPRREAPREYSLQILGLFDASQFLIVRAPPLFSICGLQSSLFRREKKLAGLSPAGSSLRLASF